jgi:hypothetical protein
MNQLWAIIERCWSQNIENRMTLGDIRTALNAL